MIIKRLHLLPIVLLMLFRQTSFAQSNNVSPEHLQCDMWEEPIGIDVPNPALSWTIKVGNPARRAMHQTGYQVIVSSTAEKADNNIGEQWNSGKILSNCMSNITYSGKRLKASRKYWWKVRIWDEKGKVSKWSRPAFWVMGLLDHSDWKADWISSTMAEKYAHSYKSKRRDFFLRDNLAEMRQYMPKPGDPNFSSMLLRKEFAVRSKIKMAVIHISGLGQYELTIDGKTINNGLLSPGWSDYAKTVLYDTYDVTSKIKTGTNAMGIILGNSLYNIQPDSIRYVKFLNTFGPLKAIACLSIYYEDGSVKTIGTDSTWQVSYGPITYSNYYGGEDFDARLIPTGWDNAGFNPVEPWMNAIKCDGPGGVLKGLSSSAAPIKRIMQLNPVKINRLKPNLLVYDLGQNTSIMPEISITGSKGAYIRIIPAELLKADGTVDRTSATQGGVRPAWWQYMMSSNKTENWFPKFFYQGARYLQVELFPAENETKLPVINQLTGVVVHSSADSIGSFSCSNKLFNQIYSLVRWAQRSNMMSIMTDCPQREKLGWLEQYHLNGPSLRYNFNLLPLFRKIMNDMADSQLPNGLIPNIAPEYFYASTDINNGFRNSPEWGSSFIIVPWQQYLFSGETTLLTRYYPRMKRYLAFLDSSSTNNLIYTGLGDWYDIGPKPAWGSQLTPVQFTATAIYFYDCQVMAQMARLLNKIDDAKMYEQKAQIIKNAFNAAFFDPVKVTYATGSNTTLAMPLFFNIAEPQYRKILAEKLAADIRKNDNAFTSGEVGYRFLLRALAMEGYSDVIYDMNNQSDKPGYGYQIKKGATSLTEKWDASVGDFGSQNHFMSGEINEWFFHDLLGIGVEPGGAGFRTILIKPTIIKYLKWVKGSYRTVSGKVTTAWRQENGSFLLDISIPANTSAMVYLPLNIGRSVKEGSTNVDKAVGVKYLKTEGRSAVYEVMSGSYHFKITH